MPFLDSLDIANRAMQHVGQPRILDVTEDTKQNSEVAFCYDKVRRAELQRNSWVFAIRRAVLRAIDTNTLVLSPDDWSSTKTYQAGAIVADGNGQFWTSKISGNLNNDPNGGDGDTWDSYFGPMTISLYDSSTTYRPGELVYELGAVASEYTIYRSLQDANSDDPSTASAWDSTVTYFKDVLVSYSGSQWRSLIQNNINVTPAAGPLAWDSGATYSSGQQVTGSDQFIYTSAVNGNLGNDPTTDNGSHWTNTGVPNAWAQTDLPVGSGSWLPIDAGADSILYEYPIGAGPASNTFTRNAFRLPAGFLDKAPCDPRAGSYSLLGAPTNLIGSDWQFEKNCITSGDSGPIILTFVADVQTVTDMNDMFCEGLACRVALEVCEPLTQSTTKIGTIASAYTKFMGEARTKNAILTGSEQPPLDDYIACRF